MNPAPMDALAYANEIRCERAATRRSISNAADAAGVIRACTNGMQVRQVLLAIPRWGERRVEAFMDEFEVAYWATLGGERENVSQPITDRQRRIVAEFLEAL